MTLTPEEIEKLRKECTNICMGVEQINLHLFAEKVATAAVNMYIEQSLKTSRGIK